MLAILALCPGGLAPTVPLLNVTGSFSTAPQAMCADGVTPTPSPFWWAIYNAPKPNTTVNSGQDQSKMHGVGAQGFINIYPAGGDSGRGWTSSVSAIWPSLVGSSTAPTKHNGGCFQAVDLEAHLADVRTGIEAQVPPDFDGYVGYDFEGA